MAIEKTFVKEGIKEAEVEEFFAQRFDKAGYSHTEIQRTPLGTRIIVYAHKPGLVVGRSGSRGSRNPNPDRRKTRWRKIKIPKVPERFRRPFWRLCTNTRSERNDTGFNESWHHRDPGQDYERIAEGSYLHSSCRREEARRNQT